ncbi:hypothetical protein CLV98_101754 [Dyadobacter jejuensis]|uniref:MFS transporter n=1 Tax=Dyadobacter jejuensis TaxID=1082580 RepID=A0A316ATF4_9BACT|nr:DUF5690 family protein [Dyadobacter jejuensis]PWJ60569.1 hypothetical protein CLV98_101754 [Dyadobacter jejuensis]
MRFQLLWLGADSCYAIMVDQLKSRLQQSDVLMILWTVLSSFGVYFCMYAFRKPFSAGLYEGLMLWGVGYKAILIIAQVVGYTLSKFVGIKVISELKPQQRVYLIVGLILIAEVALLLFGLMPHPYGFLLLFLNGLPLGMVYGVVFSFVEGRHLTEMLAMGLSISVVIASGILKTIYLDLAVLFPQISEFWMPAFMGGIFLLPFLLFVWMLTIIPDPTDFDIKQRTKRLPMTHFDKVQVLRRYGLSIFCLVLFYAGLVVVRDFRDNFTIEIWNEIDAGWENGVLAQTETISGFVVFVVIGLLVYVKSNLLAFRLTNLIMLAGMLLCGGATYLFQTGVIQGFSWMLSLGIGTFLTYTALQTVIFERFIALFRVKANAGFFVYICESIGYLGSVGLLLFKEFFMKDISWSSVLMNFTYGQVVIGLGLLLVANFLLEWQRVRSHPEREAVVFETA